MDHTTSRMSAVFMLAVAFATPASAQTGDRACFRVKDRAQPRTAAVSVTSAGVVRTCRARVPARLACLDAEDASAGGAFLCYRLHCPRPFPSPMSLTDALGGERIVSFKGAQLLCVPATSQSGGSSTTSPQGSSTTSTTIASPTSTTAPSGQCRFDDDSRTCKGTCGGGGHCAAVVSGGACECRSTPCGDADSPSCEGFCDADHACVFDLSGCSCVSIP